MLVQASCSPLAHTANRGGGALTMVCTWYHGLCSMVCYIRLPSMTFAKSVAVAFNNHIMRLPDTDTRKQLLTHEPKGVTQAIIDTVPYNKSQNFR